MVDILDDDNIRRLIAERNAKNQREGLLFAPTDYLISPSSQSNSRDEGAIFGRDMQDHRAATQGVLAKMGVGVGRFAGQTSAKTLESVGLLGGLLNIDNSAPEGATFSQYIAGAADNGLAQFAEDLDQDIKGRLALYNTKADENGGIFTRMTDADFWMGDAVDGAAFLASAYLTGGAMNSIGLGTKLATTAAKLGQFGKLATKASMNASRVANMTDWLANTTVMTASEAMFEAKGVRDNVREQESQKLFGVPFSNLSPEQAAQVDQIAAPAAGNAFKINAALLFASNAWEAKMFFGKAATPAKLGISSNGLESVAKLPTSRIGKALDTRLGKMIKKAGTGIAVEGLYEENLQFGAEKIQEKAARDGQTLNLGEQMKTGEFWKDLVSTAPNTKEGRESMFIGAILGGLGGGVSGFKEKTAQNRYLNGYTDRNGNKVPGILEVLNTPVKGIQGLGDIYKTKQVEVVDAEGNKTMKTELDLVNGQPVEDPAKVLAIAREQKIYEDLLNLAEVAERDKLPIIADLSRKQAFAKWAQAHFESGQEDGLEKKLTSILTMSDEDLMANGMDPKIVKKEAQTNLANLREYKDIHNTIEASVLPKSNSREDINIAEGRKKELYNLGTLLTNLNAHKQTIGSKVAELESQLSLEYGESQPRGPKAIELKLNKMKLDEINSLQDKVTTEFEKISDPGKGASYYKTKQGNLLSNKRSTDFNSAVGTREEFTKWLENSEFKERIKNQAKDIVAEEKDDIIEKAFNDPIYPATASEISAEILAAENGLTQQSLDLVNAKYAQEIAEEQAKIDRLAQVQMEFNFNPTDELEEELIELETYFSDPVYREAGETGRLKKLTDEQNVFNETVELAGPGKYSPEETKKTMVESLLRPADSTLSLYRMNPDYDNIDAIILDIFRTKNLISVIENDYPEIKTRLEKQLEDLEAARIEVTKRIQDKDRMQRALLEGELGIMSNGLGINNNNETVDVEIHDIIEHITGEKLDTIPKIEVKDEERVNFWARYGKINWIMSLFREKASDDTLLTLQRILDVKLKAIFDSALFQLKYQPSLQRKGLDSGWDMITRYFEAYKTNPDGGFYALMTILKDNSLINDIDTIHTGAVRTFFRTRNLPLFEEMIDKEDRKGSPVTKEMLKELIALHKQTVGVHNLIEFTKTSFNPMNEAIFEKDEAETNEIVPSYEQILAIRNILKFILSKGRDGKFGNFIFQKGFAGTGKTTVVAKWVIKSLGLTGSQFVATGHTLSSSKTINSQLGTTEAPLVEDVIEKLKNNTIGPVKVILVDEVAGLGFEQFDALFAALNEYNTTHGTDIKVIGLGDPNQIVSGGEYANFFENPYHPNIRDDYGSMTILKPLTIRYRSNVGVITDFQDLFLDRRESITGKTIIVKHTSDNQFGVDGAISPEAIQNAIKNRPVGNTTVIIVHPKDVAEYQQKYPNNEVLSYIEVQGRTIDDVFVYLNPANFNDVVDFNKAMFTASSRAAKYLFVTGIPIESAVDDIIGVAEQAAKESLQNKSAEFAEDRKEEIDQYPEDENGATIGQTVNQAAATNSNPGVQMPPSPPNNPPPASPDPNNPPATPPVEPPAEEDEQEDATEIPPQVGTIDINDLDSPFHLLEDLLSEKSLEALNTVSLNDVPAEVLYEVSTEIMQPNEHSLNEVTSKQIPWEDGNPFNTLAGKTAYVIIETSPGKGAYKRQLTVLVPYKNGYKKIAVLDSKELLGDTPYKEAFGQLVQHVNNTALPEYILTANADGTYGLPGGLKIEDIAVGNMTITKSNPLVYSYFKDLFAKTKAAVKLNIDAITNKIREAFNFNGAFQDVRVVVFSYDDLTKTNSLLNLPLNAGTPYLMVKIKNKAMQFVELGRKALNANSHNEYVKPLFSFIENYKKLTEILPVDSALLYKFVYSFDTPSNREARQAEMRIDLENPNFVFTNEMLDLQKICFDLLRTEDLIKEGSYVHPKNREFLNKNGKIAAAKIQKIEEIVGVTYATIKEGGNTITYKLDELRNTSYHNGPAAASWEAIAKANPIINGEKVIRVFLNPVDGSKSTSAFRLISNSAVDIETLEGKKKYVKAFFARTQHANPTNKDAGSIAINTLYQNYLQDVARGYEEEIPEGTLGIKYVAKKDEAGNPYQIESVESDPDLLGFYHLIKMYDNENVEAASNPITPEFLFNLLKTDSEGNLTAQKPNGQTLRVPFAYRNYGYKVNRLSEDIEEDKLTDDEQDKLDRGRMEQDLLFEEIPFSITSPKVIVKDVRSFKPKIDSTSGKVEGRRRGLSRNYTNSSTLDKGPVGTAEEAIKLIIKQNPGMPLDHIVILSKLDFIAQLGEDRWGKYKDGVIYLQETEPGKVYMNVARHEAFHHTYHAAFTKQQRNLIEKNAIKKWGYFKDIEELLAMKFQEWRAGSRINAFFTSVFNKIATLLGFQKYIFNNFDNLFLAISKGAFAEANSNIIVEKNYPDIIRDFKSVEMYRFAEKFFKIAFYGEYNMNNEDAFYGKTMDGQIMYPTTIREAANNARQVILHHDIEDIYKRYQEVSVQNESRIFQQEIERTFDDTLEGFVMANLPKISATDEYYVKNITDGHKDWISAKGGTSYSKAIEGIAVDWADSRGGEVNVEDEVRDIVNSILGFSKKEAKQRLVMALVQQGGHEYNDNSKVEAIGAGEIYGILTNDADKDAFMIGELQKYFAETPEGDKVWKAFLDTHLPGIETIGAKDYNDSPETNDPLDKLSDAVKTVFRTIPTEKVTENTSQADLVFIPFKFAFLRLIQSISGVDTTDTTKMMETIHAQFSRGRARMSAVDNRIFETIQDIYVIARNRPTHSTLSEEKRKEIYKRFKNSKKFPVQIITELRAEYFEPMDEEADKFLNQMYLKVANEKTFVEIIVQANSLHEQHVYKGIFDYESGQEKNQHILKVKLENSNADELISANNLMNSISKKWNKLSAQKKLDIQNGLNSPDVTKREKAITTFLTFFSKESAFDFSASSTNKNVGLHTYLDTLIELIDKGVNVTVVSDNGAEKEERKKEIMEILKENSTYISELVKTYNMYSQNARPGSYMRGDKKMAYFHTLSSWGINSLITLTDNILEQEDPEYFSSPLFRHNIYVGEDRIGKISDYANFDSIYNPKQNRFQPIRYNEESQIQWLDRNFNLFFGSVANNLGNENNKKEGIFEYIQQFYTISNKPNILGAKVKFLNKTEINKSIIKAITMMRERQSGEFGYPTVKNYNAKIDFFKLERADGSIYTTDLAKSDAVLLQEIQDIFKERAKILVEKMANPDNTIGRSRTNLKDRILNLEGGSYFNNLVKMTNSSDKNKEVAFNNLVENFYNNFFIQSLFLNQMVVGDPSFFKNGVEEIKRMSIAFGQGFRPFVNNDFGLRKNYRIIVGKDIESTLSSDDYEKMKFVLGKMFKSTDGQGFVTSKRAAQIRAAFGPSSNLKDIFKPIHYEIDRNGVTRATKYSSFELSKEFTDIFPSLEPLRLALEAQEEGLVIEYGNKLQIIENLKNEIKADLATVPSNKKIEKDPHLQDLADAINKKIAETQALLKKELNNLENLPDAVEFIFASGVKVGTPKDLVTSEDIANGTIRPETYFDVSNQNYRMQQNPSHDSDEESDVRSPSQLGYFIDFNNRLGDIATELYRANSILINTSLKRLLVEKNLAAVAPEGKMHDKKAMDNLRKAVSKSLVNDSDLVSKDFLNTPGLGLNMPLLAKKIVTATASIFSKNSVEIRIDGKAAVLQADYGVNSYTDVYGNKVVNKPLQWRNEYGCAEVLMSEEEAVKNGIRIGDIIMNKDMEQLAFRIPSTELHSMIPLQVVGFHTSKSAMIIAPKEIVLFHGSDYDIDKLYVLQFNRFKGDSPIYDQEGILVSKNWRIGYNKDGVPIPNFEARLNNYKDQILRDIVTHRSTPEENRANVKTMYDIYENFYKNIMVESFLAAAKNTNTLVQEIMNSPISMDMYNGASIDEESLTAFDYIVELENIKNKRLGRPIFEVERPKVESYQNDVEGYYDAISDYIRKRADYLNANVNLNDVLNQSKMHQDNFTGAKLTGIFANYTKSVAYLFKSNEESSWKEPTIGEKYHIKIGKAIYDKFTYNSSSGKRPVNVTPAGEKIYKQLTTPELADALVNSAIDNVKEQILAIIGYTNNLGQAAISMTFMGIPTNDIITMTRSTAGDRITQMGTFDDGAILGEINAVLELRKVDSEKRKEAIDLLDGIIDINVVKSSYGKTFPEMSVDELIQQILVVRALQKANAISKDVTDFGKFLSILKKLPTRNFAEIAQIINIYNRHNNLKEYVNEEGVVATDPSIVFPGIVYDKLEHISAAYKSLKTLHLKLQRSLYLHSPMLTDYIDSMLNEIYVSVDKIEDENNEEEYKEELKSKLREDFIQFTLNGLSYTDSKGNLAYVDKSDYVSPTNPANIGTKGWIDDFISRVEEAKSNTNNSFLNNLSVEKNYSQKYLTYRKLADLDYADILEHRNSFSEITLDKQDFVIYSILTQGINFGGTNYSMVIPPENYKFIMEPYNEFLESLMNDGLFATYIANVKNLFMDQVTVLEKDLSIRSAKGLFNEDRATTQIKYNVKAQDKYYDLALYSPNRTPGNYVSVGNRVYKLMVQTGSSENKNLTYYFMRLGTKGFGTYVHPEKLLYNGLDFFSKEFTPELSKVRFVGIAPPVNGMIENARTGWTKLQVGDKVTYYLVGDINKLKPYHAEISKINLGEEGSSTTYDLKIVEKIKFDEWYERYGNKKESLSWNEDYYNLC